MQEFARVFALGYARFLDFQRLEEQNEQLQKLDAVKTEFFSNVSHELRTPMTSIKGYVDNMLDRIGGELTERQERYLKRIKANTDRLTRLINDLLDLSRIDRGRTDLLQLEISRIQVLGVVREAFDSLRPVARNAGIELGLEGDPVLSMADRDRLVQVMNNLIGNAIKFTPNGGRVDVRIKSTGDGFVEVSVVDTGSGIPTRDLDRIFDRFYQVKREDRKPGTGLGLPISKEIVELHGGRIWAESKVGSGSTFRFTLPEIV